MLTHWRGGLRLLSGVLAATLFVGRQSLAQQSAAVAPKPNIVLIVADDLGYGDLGCYGQQKVLTPNIDRLAAEGCRFTQAYAGTTVCAPSRCALMTGLHTGHALIRGNAKVDLRPEDRTVAEMLQSAGYNTAAMGKWGLGSAGTSGTPTKKGFDYFHGFIDQTHAHNSYPSYLYRNEERVPLRNVVPNEGPYGQGVAMVKMDFVNDLFTSEILGYLDRQSADKPFFLYAPYTAPHANNEAHTSEVPDLGAYATNDWPESEKRLAALITRLDTYVGQIMQKLKDRRLDENTLVIFVSDNGPHEEGGNQAAYFHSSGPLRGIKRDVYEGGIRVPMITRWPGHVAPGATSTEVFAFWDFYPTAAEIAGSPIPKDIDGLPMESLLLGKAPAQRHEFLYWEFHEGGFHQAVRMGDWKVIRHGIQGPIELYDLKNDVGESKNVAANHADIVKKISDYLTTARAESKEFPVRN